MIDSAPYKKEILDDLEEDQELSFYRDGKNLWIYAVLKMLGSMGQ